MASGQTVRLIGATQRAFAHKLVDAAPDGAVLNVREATRTSAQNDMMWGLLSDISRAKPEGRNLTTEKWKALFMDAVGVKADWEPGIFGGIVNVGYRSSRLSKDKMSEMLDCIQAYGTEHNVKWTAPDAP